MAITIGRREFIAALGTAATWPLAAHAQQPDRMRRIGVLYSPHMASKETTLKELGEMLAHVVEHMATKEDIAALAGQLTSMEGELKAICRELNDLSKKVENVSGFRKEIDHALGRIAAIEKHLGINKKIAA